VSGLSALPWRPCRSDGEEDEEAIMAMSKNEVLSAAARSALRAPSVFNTQPWRWVLEGDVLELRADRKRQLAAADPLGNMLVASCGAALHHARLSVVVSGWTAEVDRLPDPRRPDLLAQVRVGEPYLASTDERAMYEAINRRRSDRRPFGDEPVSDEAIARLDAAAEAETIHLQRVGLTQMPMFGVAVGEAGWVQMGNADYRSELMRWVNRPVWSGDGVPADTTVRHVPRRVAIRELTLPPEEGVQVEPGGDRGSVYLVLFGDGDDPVDWLRAGEGLSAVLLTAVALDLSAAPISDVIEVAATRRLVQALLRRPGYPYVAVRCGHGVSPEVLGDAPRREPTDAIRGLSND
jgi:nitroreductase